MQPRILWITSRLPAEEALLSDAALRAHVSPPAEALERLRHNRYDAAVIEERPGEWSAESLLESVHGIDPGLPVLIRGRLSPADAVRLFRPGAAPLPDRSPDVEAPRAPDGSEPWRSLLVGESREMRQVGHIIRLVGPRRSTVLITGETGTGKELAARALHLAGPRRRGPLVAINCSAVPANLLEAELFGHVRGAFTGAQQSRTGRFEQAHGGTLFLDEVGELPLELQAKLLRVLQEREIQRLGSSETVRIDVRVIAATNCDLPRAVAKGLFREDLFYRLNVVPLVMPPLRDRREDIPLLVAHFLAKICGIEGLPLKTVEPEALQSLEGRRWPGNVRQLENAVEMAVALSGERGVLRAGDFPLPEGELRNAAGPGPVVALPEGGLDFERTLTSIERSILEQALRRTGGNKKAAADMLGLKRTTLAAKMRTLETMCN